MNDRARPTPHPGRRLALPACAALVAALLSAGCGRDAGAVRCYVHPLADLAAIKTVAVLPLSNLTDGREADAKLRNLLVMKLLDTGLFNVIEPGEVDKALQGVQEGHYRGKVTADTLQLLKAKLKADAAVVGSLDDYAEATLSNQRVPEVTASVRMLDIETGAIVWMASQNIRGAYVDTILGFTRSHASTYPQVCERVVRRLVDSLRESAVRKQP